MIKITFDTNLLIELFDLEIEPKTIPSVGKILKHCFDWQGVDLKITTAVTKDIIADKDTVRFLAISTRINNTFSVLGAGYVTKDMLPKDSVEKTNFLELKQILFPNLVDTDNHYRNKINDVHHLHCHIKAGRDVFITNDSDILKKKDSIKTAFNTLVMNPSECAKYLESVESSSGYPYKKHAGRSDYYSSGLSGEVKFDFTNNDHKYTIGSSDLLFETRWSECNIEKMYAYNDSTSIEALAVAEDVPKFKDIKDFNFYDSTSRSREVTKDKDVLILKNSKGYFAVLKIVDIQSKSRGSLKNELIFKYLIQPNGSCNFKGMQNKVKSIAK
jgi:hypothetical protein